jgi:hypothetical protein
MLAKVNSYMMEIWRILESNPTIAARGCGVRQYQGLMAEGEECCFEAYVDAKTCAAEVLCWLLDITLTSSGWNLRRFVGKQSKDGEDLIIAFENPTFRSLDALAGNYLALVTEFVEPANNFDFDL